MKTDQKNIKNPYDIDGLCNKCGTKREISNCIDCKIQKEHQKMKRKLNR